ncbi:hypothetical protein LEP1GSC104_3056 [Leptospira interrogans str. UI 12621]|uniref:Uncharacterized protein n=1 Tax=Leptospira interrogans str. UI 12621 TaxID=1049937 RepID=A0A0F6HDS8_LEPIR|nr:hypothetical protein LEP1GSC104_3056 [Leptospira interrogans str. UI 12621]
MWFCGFVVVPTFWDLTVKSWFCGSSHIFFPEKFGFVKIHPTHVKRM